MCVVDCAKASNLWSTSCRLLSRAFGISHHAFRLRKLCVPEIRVAERLASINQSAAHRVSEVVLCTRAMINAVLAASRRSALKRHKLSAQSVVIKQCSSPRIYQRQGVLIKLAF